MSFHATLDRLIAILGASFQNLPSSDAKGITTDTRSIQPGEVFLALRGERFDGHDFVRSAIEQGAIAAIVDSEFEAGDLPVLIVQDTLQAYQAIGHWWRKQFKIPIIAITGSVGKTTTKELIAAVLSKYGKVHKTQANYNNEIGVPKTLLELNSDHDFAVIEMGMRALGEIALLSQIASPDISVITNVGTAHIGRLGSREAIAQAKCELLAEMPEDAVAILNHDNPLLLETANTIWHGKSITYGLQGGDLQGQLIDTETLKVRNDRYPLPLPGEHNALNFLAALAVIKALDLDASNLTTGVEVELPSGRARRYELSNDVVILDESYNAGLESMLASLKLLAQTKGDRRIAVLGTMKELGDWSIHYHQQVGEQVKELKLDQLLILADPDEAQAMAIAASPIPAETFTDYTEVIARLNALIQPGDRLLFKASRAVGLDRVVTALIPSK
ncbi:UDP-N-acetylmuramoyl-tripeptide--D-alanyl-D-alanine ligase [Leptolyngbya sp. NIES-2104]|uniref:UDP-N-acetylmuramoyl-tripeptide--D-alanyl-D- alanine ligase n=1 Tax=Leptolyngbya sp. NIES-2104 TaxID=1552121 RepID=UPI0006ECB308|nr:UDP-N-acetylmuramoyl-tripeptide--D-alanyl-D-alanine ligase [Leptolyngbya sp. NIES-2104]GAP95311.1 UDP-N-acetylmuramoylalanyl-D-glutamyl-2,6-diaminopimelate--D-alanyl-D-alanine ligase [Leptolyngbya sp. NIES-2104]